MKTSYKPSSSKIQEEFRIRRAKKEFLEQNKETLTKLENEFVKSLSGCYSAKDIKLIFNNDKPTYMNYHGSTMLEKLGTIFNEIDDDIECYERIEERQNMLRDDAVYFNNKEVKAIFESLSDELNSARLEVDINFLYEVCNAFDLIYENDLDEAEYETLKDKVKNYTEEHHLKDSLEAVEFIYDYIEKYKDNERFNELMKLL